MADVPTVVGRPMPIENIACWRLAIPVKLHFAPQRIDRLANRPLCIIVAIKVLTSGKQSLNKERRLHQIAAVVILAEIRIHAPRASIKKMRPDSVETIGAAQKAQNLLHSAGAGLPIDKAALCGDELRHDAESRCANRD